jgi:hypothetical protein
MHVKLILHEFGTCKIDFTYIRYYLAAKIDFTGFPILAAPDLIPEVGHTMVSLIWLLGLTTLKVRVASNHSI